jgi:tetratricopeptide (TPR) repeat protein
VVPLWVLARRDLGLLKRRAASAAMFLCGVAMLLLPVALRNYAVGSTFAVTSYNVGQNFFLGNNPDATGVYEPLIHSRQDPQYEREDAERLAERALGRDLTAGEVSSYWFRRGVQYAIDQPADWLKLTARKSLLTWNRFEVPDTEDPGLYAEHSVILRWLSRFVHFGVLAPLGVAGMVLAWRRRGRVAVLYILVLAATASAAIFFVFARYRYPLVAPLVLFAGFAVVQMATLLRDRRAARLLAAIAFAAVVALVVNRPMLAEGAYRSVAYVNLAGMHEKLGEGEKADAALQRALELYADNALAHFHLGRLLVKRGAAESAERHLLRAVAIDPELYVGYAALSDLYEGQGRATEAASQLRTAVTLAPDEAELHLRLGGVLLRLGAREEAAHEFAVAIDLTPGLEERLSKQERAITEQARQESADLLGRARRARSAGDYLLAIQLYEEATAIYPQDASLHYELASALAAVNDEPRAITFFERALELDPDLTAAHNDLGQLLTGMGAFDKAIEHYRAAIRVEPDMIPSHYNLATTLAAAGRIEEALAAMEQCLEVARRRGSADVVARVEDRLARLREDQSRRQSPIEP